MRAVILAAGRGSRLGSLTDERPKCLVELRGRPLLERQIEALTSAGIEEIAIVTGYQAGRLAGYSDTRFHNRRWDETNMVRSLGAAAEWLAAGPCLVAYSDIFYSPETVRALAEEDTAPIAIAYDPDWRRLWEARFEDPLSDAESFRLDLERSVTEIGARTSSLDEIEGQYMGLLRFTPQGWRAVEELLDGLPAEAGDRLDMTGLLSRLIDRGLKIRAVPCVGPWGEVDQPSDIAHYESMAVELPGAGYDG